MTDKVAEQGTDGVEIESWRAGRLPAFFEASPEPPADRLGIRVDGQTTERRLVLRTMFGNPSRTIPAAVLIVGHQTCEALVPVVMGLAIDRGVATGDVASVVRWVLVLGVVFTALTFCFRFGSRIGFLGMNTVQHELRTMVSDRIMDPRGMGGPGRSPGVALSIATSDVTRLAMTVAASVYPVGEIAAVVFCGIVLLWISWPLGLLVLIGAPLILWLLDRAGGSLRTRSETEQAAAATAAGSAADLVAGFRVIKGIRAEREAGARYESASGRALAAVIRARRAQGAYVAAMEAVATFFVVLVGVTAGVLTVRGDLTAGQLITVVGLTQFVMAPLSALGTNFGKIWVAGHASAKRVLSVLQAPYLRDEVAAPVAGGARFRPVTVSGLPTPGGPSTFEFPREGVTVVVADVEITSALEDLLSRAVVPDDGVSVTVGEHDLTRLDHADALRAVRVAPHASVLFEGTVGENVAAAADGDTGRSDAALLAAACDDVVDVLPDGLDTPVGEAGRLLSGGQRQRVALARALAADSETLVLVDPTSAVDSVTETTIAQRLGVIREGRSTVVFTHSPTFAAHADTVLHIGGDGTVRRDDYSVGDVERSAQMSAPLRQEERS